MKHRWFFWPFAAFANGVVGRFRCARCGINQPDGWRVSVGGRFYRYGEQG